MSEYRIGQRVRVRYAVFPVAKKFVGMETHITEGLRERAGGQWVGYRVALDENFAPRHDQLEPIVPDGHRSGDYSYTELMDRLKAGEVECV